MAQSDLKHQLFTYYPALLAVPSEKHFTNAELELGVLSHECMIPSSKPITVEEVYGKAEVDDLTSIGTTT